MARLVSPRIELERGLRGECCLVELAGARRMAVTITAAKRPTFRHQLDEVLAILRSLLDRRDSRMSATVLTVFLANARRQRECERAFEAMFGFPGPVINYVFQPPCCGAGIALEAWAIGGEGVRVEHLDRQALAVTYDGVRWVHCGIEAPASGASIYQQTLRGFGRLRDLLRQADSGFEHVVRTWLYLGGITAPAKQGLRYEQLNAARADFYRSLRFRGPSVPEGYCLSRSGPGLNASSPEDVEVAPERAALDPSVAYPASTGIGMNGRRLTMSCMAAQTQRRDAALVSLENPNQTPAYSYHANYSSQSPRFSRAMALVLGKYITTWISGTASIVGSESRHPDDLQHQAEQTIDNIERLISPGNFAAHGYPGAGAELRDLAKIRVYLKRPEDLDRCREICERRFGPVPAIYAVADICRPELLVEIEGVTFSRYTPASGS